MFYYYKVNMERHESSSSLVRDFLDVYGIFRRSVVSPPLSRLRPLPLGPDVAISTGIRLVNVHLLFKQ